MKIPREYQNLSAFLKQNKALIILGPRQSGKTTLLNDFLSGSNLRYKLDSGDDIRVQEILGSQDFARILAYASGYQLIAVDEAQRIKNVGLGLKILVDQIPGIFVIATGSSSFELSGQIGEPLTGRKTTLTLYPIAQMELAHLHNRFELKSRFEESMIFGSYPEVVAAADKNEKIRLLNELVGSYLLRDVLQLERVKSSKLLLDLLRLLAFQIGNEVSWSELANRLGIDTKTVARYLDLFEKGFVKLKEKHPEILVGLRQLGLMMGIEMVNEYCGPAMSLTCYKNGILSVYANNDKRISQLLPPLIITRKDAEEILERLDAALGDAKVMLGLAAG